MRSKPVSDIKVIDSDRKDKLKSFLEVYGLAHTDLELVNKALTHRSYSFEEGIFEDNERLEFLGDAFLGLLVSRYLYDKHPQADEGPLSKRKARIVSRSMLGRQAKTLGLGDFILLGKGEEQTGGRRRSTMLGCTLEALIGALYLSASLQETSRFIQKEIIEPAEKLLHTDLFTDYKSLLQEYAQKHFQCIPEYKVVEESGPDHKKSFHVEVFINIKSYGIGNGPRKKSAENAAARIAYETLTS